MCLIKMALPPVDKSFICHPLILLMTLLTVFEKYASFFFPDREFLISHTSDVVNSNDIPLTSVSSNCKTTFTLVDKLPGLFISSKEF